MISLLQVITGIAVVNLVLGPTTSLLAAEDRAKLPEPLTLEYALSLADEVTPNLQLYQADIAAAQAGIKAAESLSGFNSLLEARARWVDPADLASDQDSDDHRLGIIATQTLYDFGRSYAAETSAQHSLEASKLLYFDARQRRRIEIMQRYFDVLLADLRFFRYNEEMATAFLAMDRMRDRRELGQASDLDVLEKEVENQRIRHLRYKSENEQRRTRALLAQALNRPEQLSATLAKPKLPQLKRKLDEVEKYQQLAKINNPLLKSFQLQVIATEQKVKEARAIYNPTLQGKVEAYSYSRELGSSDNWRAGVTLEVPLTTGGNSDARVATAQAQLYRARAKLRDRQFVVQQAVLETWLELGSLRIRLDEMHANSEYRELYLDRSRALYEMEVKTDLGDAMVKVSEAERNLRQIEFNIALAWARLEALTGQMPSSIPNSHKTNPPQ